MIDSEYIILYGDHFSRIPFYMYISFNGPGSITPFPPDQAISIFPISLGNPDQVCVFLKHEQSLSAIAYNYCAIRFAKTPQLISCINFSGWFPLGLDGLRWAGASRPESGTVPSGVIRSILKSSGNRWNNGLFEDSLRGPQLSRRHLNIKDVQQPMTVIFRD